MKKLALPKPKKVISNIERGYLTYKDAWKKIQEKRKKTEKIMKAYKFAKPKKVSISKLKKKLLEIIKADVRKRDKFTCQHCHKVVEGSNCHVSHVIPVSHGNALMFDEQNMKVLCYHCHLNWWHKSPMEAWQWFSSTFPDRWAYLQLHKNDTVHWKAQDYEQMIFLIQERKFVEKLKELGV